MVWSAFLLACIDVSAVSMGDDRRTELLFAFDSLLEADKESCGIIVKGWASKTLRKLSVFRWETFTQLKKIDHCLAPLIAFRCQRESSSLEVAFSMTH